MTDVIFFLKSVPTSAIKSLPWPRPTKCVALDPGSLGCEGADRLCSSAYSRMWQTYGGPDGRFVETMLQRNGISDPEHIAFLGFSAAHGLLNPLANNDSDRALISAYVLMDATFGGGKSGYVKFLADASAGQRLLITATSNTGGDEGWSAVWAAAQSQTGIAPKTIEPRPPLPNPSGGAYQLGKLGFYYRFVNASGSTELPHWEMHKIQTDIVSAYLLPYWQGKLATVPWKKIAGTAVLTAGMYGAYRIWKG